MNYQFTSALSAQLRVGGDVENARGFAYNAVNAPDPGSWNAGGNTEGTSRTPDVGSVIESNNYVGGINGDFILKYNKDISNNFNLDVIGGVNFNQADTKSGFAAITNLLIPGFYNLSNSTKQPTTAGARVVQDYLGFTARRRLGIKTNFM